MASNFLSIDFTCASPPSCAYDQARVPSCALGALRIPRGSRSPYYSPRVNAVHGGHGFDNVVQGQTALIYENLVGNTATEVARIDYQRQNLTLLTIFLPRLTRTMRLAPVGCTIPITRTRRAFPDTPMRVALVGAFGI